MTRPQAYKNISDEHKAIIILGKLSDLSQDIDFWWDNLHATKDRAKIIKQLEALTTKVKNRSGGKIIY